VSEPATLLLVFAGLVFATLRTRKLQPARAALA
jgi:hypothetical protein